MPAVLPPGTSSWIGSGFECGCECTFEAGFTYADDKCLLIFAVRALKTACISIEFDLADLTVEIRLNGTPISASLIPYTDSNGGGGIWEVWKPEAGDVYSATVSLNCGYGETFSREFEITIPDPANSACNCCTERTIDYVVVSGLTDDVAIMNGTYALEPTGVFGCAYGPIAIAGPPLPENPCGIFGANGNGLGGDGTYPCPLPPPDSPDALFMEPPTIICGITLARCYFHPGGGSVSATIGAEYVDVTIQYGRRFSHFSYSWDDLPNNCAPGNRGTCVSGFTWVFRINCVSGATTLLSGPLTPYLPSVLVALVDR
jgi:hypothetical protein